jgi:hypothetical protein
VPDLNLPRIGGSAGVAIRHCADAAPGDTADSTGRSRRQGCSRPTDRHDQRKEPPMYAAAHTSLALAASRRVPAASLLGLMVAAQASELLWVVLTYAGIEHPTVDDAGVLHLEYLPYSHSLLVGLGGGLLLWAVLRLAFKRRDVATVFGLVFASHIVLDVIQHEPNIRLVPWLPDPTIGLNLTALPWLDFAVETALCVACWWYYRGSRKLLIGLLALNIANLPLMLGGEGAASPMAQHPFLLPTVILYTILIAWGVVYRYADSTRHQASRTSYGREPAAITTTS